MPTKTSMFKTFPKSEKTLSRRWTENRFSPTLTKEFEGEVSSIRRKVKVSEDRTIDTALLFQTFLVVSKTGDFRLDDIMSYELCLIRCLRSKEKISCVLETNRNW